MDTSKKLFKYKNVYDTEGTNELFSQAVKENVIWHFQNCSEYREILNGQNFDPAIVESYKDLYRIPPIPTLYLKQHRMLSIPERKLRFKSTTSGTSGNPVEVGFDANGMLLGFRMMLKMLLHHDLLSLHPANYLILGYQPSKRNKMGAARTARAATYLAPALHKEYALIDTGVDYELNIEGILKTLKLYSLKKTPVRVIGFPAYFYFLLKKLEQENLVCKLPEKSLVFLGGGWKQFAEQKVSKAELRDLAAKWLGLKGEQCKEFFGVVEHNVPYFSCRNNHFHVPIYSRIIIRDIKTIEPVEYGKPGLLNMITPILKSMPLVSILTDDIATIHEGRECGCGNNAPYFEVLGRAGLQNIKTCAAGAGSILEGLLK